LQQLKDLKTDLFFFPWKAKLASGHDGDALRPFTEGLTVAISSYKTTAATVRSLLPKAKAKAKAQSKAAEAVE